jgi:hypothetical protein
LGLTLVGWELALVGWGLALVGGEPLQPGWLRHHVTSHDSLELV